MLKYPFGFDFDSRRRFGLSLKNRKQKKSLTKKINKKSKKCLRAIKCLKKIDDERFKQAKKIHLALSLSLIIHHSLNSLSLSILIVDDDYFFTTIIS